MNRSDAAEREKPALRRLATARRDGLSPEARASGSLAIAARCNAIIAVLQPRAIAGYLPIRTEVDARPILDKARVGGAEIALPAIVAPLTMVFRRYRPGEPMMIGGFGTLAPAQESPVVEPDLVILPMVGFDRTGARLGHGKGYYDRTLGPMANRVPFLGVAFSVQEVGHIPHEPHDIRLNWVITEKETLDFRGKP